jgi:hypothetical protein
MGFWLVTFANFAINVAACCVEIAQRHAVQPVGRGIVGEHPLHHQLRPAIGIDRPLPMRLADGHMVGHAIGRACAGEQKLADACRAHPVEQGKAADAVVPVI